MNLAAYFDDLVFVEKPSVSQLLSSVSRQFWFTYPIVLIVGLLTVPCLSKKILTVRIAFDTKV